ncbi:MAG: phytoene desaturase family protein [Vicinamibacteria bacterium]
MKLSELPDDDPRKPAYLGRRSPPEPRYDAVVIGAGVGGLVCGNLLAKAGLKVLIIEQHYVAGGYCSTFRRKGYVFDAATHFYPLLGNPDTITGRLLNDIGIPTRWVKMDPVDQFHFPDGSSFAVPADFDTYLTKLKGDFPEENGALDAFFAEVRQVYYHGLLHYFRWRDSPRLEPYREQTLRQALDRHFRDRKLKLLLAADVPHWGSPPERTSFVFDSMLRLSYFLGNYYPVGGSQVFADDLARRFEAQGGHLCLRTLGLKILTEDGRARGVEIETGLPSRRTRHTVLADRIISNGDLLRTYEEMLGPDQVEPEYVAELRTLRPSMPCFLSHIGLRDVSEELLNEVSGYYWDSWDTDAVGQTALRFKIFAPTLFERRMAPPGGQVVIIQRVREIDYEAIQDWPAHKAELERFALDHLEKLIPGLPGKTVVMSSASARTSYRYTLNRRGAMLGWEMSPDQLGRGRPEVTGPIDGLYFVGHWTRPGGGITPVIVSAMRVAELITASPAASLASGHGKNREPASSQPR